MYELPSFRNKVIEVAIYGSLLLLIPLAGLAFFSEGSIPGQPLYPVKRSVENLIAGLDSFDKNAQAVYKLGLVDRRFTETKALLSNNSVSLDTSQINDFATQIEEARDSINTVSDVSERIALRKKLLQNIIDYRNQLTIIQSQNNSSGGVQNSSQEPTSDAQQTQYQSSPSQTPDTSQVSSLNLQLQQLQGQIQQDQNNNTYSQNQYPSPSATQMPLPTNQLTPPLTNYPTPTSFPTSTVAQNTPCTSCYMNGVPFIDANHDGKFEAGESFYDYNVNPTLTFSIYDANGNLLGKQTQNGGQTTNPYWYSFTSYKGNTNYTIKLDTVPSGFALTTGQDYTVIVGSVCNVGASLDAKCSVNGSINSLNFGFVYVGGGNEFRNYKNGNFNNGH